MDLTKSIQETICREEILKGNIPCENVSFLFYRSEVDVASILKSGYIAEYEVKISRSDFKADFKKAKWKYFDHRIETGIPNYFYYVCPEGMIEEHEIQDFAGLVYVNAEGEPYMVKKAKILHRHKQDPVKVLRKFCRVKSEREYFGECLMTYKNRMLTNG